MLTLGCGPAMGGGLSLTPIANAMAAPTAAIAAPPATAGATGVLDVDWRAAGSAAGLAALVSLLTSVVASGVGAQGTAALLSSSKSEAGE